MKQLNTLIIELYQRDGLMENNVVKMPNRFNNRMDEVIQGLKNLEQISEFKDSKIRIYHNEVFIKGLNTYDESVEYLAKLEKDIGDDIVMFSDKIEDCRMILKAKNKDDMFMVEVNNV
jgi:hypothetical protein